MKDRIHSESAPAAWTHSLCFSFYKVTWNYYDTKISYWKPSSTIPANLIPLTPPITWTHVCKHAVLVQWDIYDLETMLDIKQDIPLVQWDTQDLETTLDTKRELLWYWMKVAVARSCWHKSPQSDSIFSCLPLPQMYLFSHTNVQSWPDACSEQFCSLKSW